MERELDLKTFRLDRPGIRAVLGDLEAEIMECVWARPQGAGITVRDVFAVLHARRGSAYTTVMSTMTRLARKGLLRMERDGVAHVYYAVCTQEEFLSRFLSRALENLFVAFSGSELIRGESPAQQTSTHVKQLVDEIARRRTAEELA